MLAKKQGKQSGIFRAIDWFDCIGIAQSYPTTPFYIVNIMGAIM